jgi:hypothetical protein
MNDQSDSGSPYSVSGALTIRMLIPYFFAAAAFGYAVWNQANDSAQLHSNQSYQEEQISQLIADNKAYNISQLQATVAFQGQQISILIADDKAGQTFSYSIQSELAQQTQSLADIKAAETQHGTP